MSRSAVRTLAPYRPGTTIEEVRRRFGLERVVKLASNENPLGSSPLALAALQDLGALHLYADDAHLDLKEKLAAPYGFSHRNVVLGHGSNELVQLIAEATLEPGDEALMAAPSFLLYPLVTRVRGALPVEVPLRDGVHDLEAMLAAISPRTRLVFVCDPNNPTGTALDPGAWERFVAALPDDVTLLVDQAYREYAGPQCLDAAPWVERRPGTIVVRTMSKVYGLAALRFGYGFGDAETIGWLERIRLPFNVSQPAAIAARAALDDGAFVARSLAVNDEGKAEVRRRLAQFGLFAYPTQANFYAMRVPADADATYEALLRRGVVVRSGNALGLPGYLRVTIGTAEQNAVFFEALEELQSQWPAPV